MRRQLQITRQLCKSTVPSSHLSVFFLSVAFVLKPSSFLWERAAMGAGWRGSEPRPQRCEPRKPGPRQERGRMPGDPCPARKATACPGCHSLWVSAAQRDTPKQPFSSAGSSPPNPVPRVQERDICGPGRHHPSTCSHANAGHKPVLFGSRPPHQYSLRAQSSSG